MKLAFVASILLGLAAPAFAGTVQPGGAFHTEDGVDLAFSDGFMSFAGDFPGNGFAFGGGFADPVVGLSTSGAGVLTAGGWSGDFLILTDVGDIFLSGSFSDLTLGDLSLTGMAQVTGGTAASLFGSTAVFSLFSPDLAAGYEGIPGEVAFIDDAVFQLEAAVPPPVPLPAALPLLLAGLAGLSLIRRRA